MSKNINRIVLWFSLILFHNTSFSQNLILNGDCEQYIGCPENAGQIDSLLNFKNFTNYSTPDYLNSCSSNQYTTIPSDLGYQIPHSGNGFIHLALILAFDYPRSFIYDQSNDIQYRESVKGFLSQPLIKDKQYKFEVYINYSSNGDSISCSDRRIATSNIDVIFFDTISNPIVACPPFFNFPEIINLNPSGNIINDTLNWEKLSVCYTAKGGEKHFAIGSFRDTSLLNLKFTDCFMPNSIWFASYFFDDFSMVQCDTCCGNIPPSNPFVESLDIANSASTNSKPIVFTANLYDNSYAKMEIYDSRGRIVERHTFSTDDNLYTPSISLQKALYHFRFETENGFYQSGKFVVVE